MMERFEADEIEHLEYPMNVIRRPSMYLGERGTQQSVGCREITDNAAHEVIRGFATTIKIVFGRDKSITVQDDGRGLPVDINAKTKKNGIILTMATLHAGGNFSSSIEVGKAGAGLNGVGASATNALSKRFSVEVFKNNKMYELSFKDGIPGHFDGPGPDAAFTKSDKIIETKDPRSAADKKGFKTGTKIQFWYNESRFPKDESVDIDDLIERLKFTSYIVPGMKIEIIDENRTHEDGSFYTWSFYSEHGLPEMVEVSAKDEMLPGTNTVSNGKIADIFEEKGIYTIKTDGGYTELSSDEKGNIKEVDRTVTAEVAFRYGTGYEKNLSSFVNTIHTHLGGVHEQALEKAIIDTFGARMSSMRGIMTAKDPQPVIDDFFEGMTIMLSVNVPEPQFVGQQKDKLSGPEVKKALTKALTDELQKFVNAPNNQKFLKPMFVKVANAAKNRQASLNAKLAKRKANAVSSSAMPAKLSDCEITGEEESELLICEGDSAKGTIVKARNSMYQAVLPIRGKIVNAYKAKLPEVIKNEEVMSIAKALGAGFGKDFDIDKIRYGKVIFAADSDVDGSHINMLLYTVFNSMFKDMILEGRVYQAVPPLYEVTETSGRTKKTHYIEDDFALKRLLKKLDSAKKTYKINRNKGLGELEPEVFSETVLDPETRVLKRITLKDVKRAEQALELTMGQSSQDRKDFLNDNFQVAIDTGLVQGFEGDQAVLV